MKKIILGTAIAAALVLPAVVGDSNAGASPSVHPDCIDNAHPEQCNQIVQTLLEEQVGYLQAHLDFDLDEVVSYYLSPSVVVSGLEDVCRGQAAYREALAPFVENGLTSVVFDLSSTRFQVISPDLVVQYGLATSDMTFQDGSTGSMLQRVMMVWTRNQVDHTKPYVIAAGSFEVI